MELIELNMDIARNFYFLFFCFNEKVLFLHFTVIQGHWWCQHMLHVRTLLPQ